VNGVWVVHSVALPGNLPDRNDSGEVRRSTGGKWRCQKHKGRLMIKDGDFFP
jgi:hypothetical protein